VRRLPFTDHVVVSKLFHPSTPPTAHIRAEASNSVPVAIGSRRIFAAPLDLACRNLADVDVLPYARFAPTADICKQEARPGLATITGAMRQHCHPFDISVEMSGPHDFAVRRSTSFVA